MKTAFSVIAILALIFCFTSCEKGYAPAPQITEGEFPFVFEYELDGQRFVIEDAVVCTFTGYDLSNPFPFMDYSRTWISSLKSGKKGKRQLIKFDENTESVMVKGRINTESQVNFYYGSGGYYLGDPNDADRGPCINYIEKYKISEKVSFSKATPLTDEQLEEYFGIKIIKFEFSEPIVNRFE